MENPRRDRVDMGSSLKKWGNSVAVRIPAAVLAAAKLEPDQAVEVWAEKGRVVIEPKRTRVFVLADLVRRITPKNRHEVVDTGAAVGREVW